ncbi:hypothetical protein ACJJIP_05210 [Microbulbifer sp. VTAC004]|uniref:hypothetical protein n=1 Tax=Microbulbifer sp. VTAC004 TaxID=3243386 RepID=UPI0040394055
MERKKLSVIIVVTIHTTPSEFGTSSSSPAHWHPTKHPEIYSDNSKRRYQRIDLKINSKKPRLTHKQFIRQRKMRLKIYSLTGLNVILVALPPIYDQVARCANQTLIGNKGKINELLTRRWMFLSQCTLQNQGGTCITAFLLL